MTALDTSKPVLAINGRVEFNEPCTFPKDRSFAIVANNGDPTAALYYTGPNKDKPAITIAPGTIADFGAADGRQVIDGVRLISAKLAVNGGGKIVRLKNLRITDCAPGAPALTVNGTAGFAIEDSYIHDNACNGVLMQGCTSDRWGITSRQNQGYGLRAENCSSCGSYVYGESNVGKNIELVGCSRLTLDNSWSENAGWGGPGTQPTWNAQYQGLRRNCWDLSLRGQFQQDNWQAWDDDPVSAAFCPAPADLKGLAGYQINGAALIPKLTNPPLGMTAGPGGLTIPAGVFDKPLPQMSLEFVDPTQKMNAVPFAAGDSLVVEYKISSPQWSFLRTQNVDHLRFMGGNNSPPTLGQSLRIVRNKPQYGYTWPELFTVSGTGPRVWGCCWFFPSGPAQSFVINVTANAYLLPGWWR